MPAGDSEYLQGIGTDKVHGKKARKQRVRTRFIKQRVGTQFYLTKQGKCCKIHSQLEFVLRIWF